ncbi:MAG: HAD family hydrolase [Alphaproteobacteria bacterium]|nr:HAD family hydrolase [Alphaproteobacteria bacterium]
MPDSVFTIPHSDHPANNKLVVGLDLNGTLLNYDKQTGAVTPIKGALETLKYLKAQNIPFFIATNDDGDKLSVEEKLMKAFPEDYESIFGNLDTPDHGFPIFKAGKESLRRKPAPFLLLDGYKNYEGYKRVYIGNTPHDMRAAERAGALPILVGEPRQEHNLPIETSHSITHQDLPETLHMLRYDHLLNFSDDPQKASEIKNPHAGKKNLVRITQGKDDLQTLLARAQEMQYALVRKAILVTFRTFLKTRDNASDLLESVEKSTEEKWSKLSDEERSRTPKDKYLAMHFNKLAKEMRLDIRIIANGPKNEERTKDKALARGKEENAIDDLIRIKFTSKSFPETLHHIRDRLVTSYPHVIESMHMRDGGNVSDEFNIAFHGLIADISIGEKDQVNRADRISHLMYEIRRDFELPNDSKLESVIQRIRFWSRLIEHMMQDDFVANVNSHPSLESYINHVSRGLAQEKNSPIPDHDITKVLRAIDNKETLFYLSTFLRDYIGHKDARAEASPTTLQRREDLVIPAMMDDELEALSPDEKKERVADAVTQLQNVHKLVHIAYIRDADPSWQQEYVKMARELNQKKGAEIIPERMLDMINNKPKSEPLQPVRER